MTSVYSNMGKQAELSDIIGAPVDVEKLLESLDFADEDVLDAAKQQATLYLSAARFRIQCMRRRTRAESELKVVSAEKSLGIRNDASASGERISNDAVAERVLQSTKVKQLRDKLLAAEEEEEFGKLLIEAFRMRRDALKVVAELIGAEVYLQRRDNQEDDLTKTKKSLRDKWRSKRRDGEDS